MTPEAQLARAVLTYLAQAAEADRARDADLMRDAKRAAKKLAALCEQILAPKPPAQPGLFDEPDPFAGTKWASKKEKKSG